MRRKVSQDSPAQTVYLPPGASRPSLRLLLGLLAVVLIVGIAAYANSLNGPFIFDDLRFIPENEHLRQLWPPSRTLWAPAQGGLAGRPVVAFSLALNYAINGLNVRGYHLVNIALHLASTLLLLGILHRTFPMAPLVERFGRSALILASAGAAFWLLHPLQTEAVTYISQRTELLMAFFYLLTLYGAIRAWTSTLSRQRTLWSVLAIVACAFGMGSKEVMVSAPLVVLIYDYTFVSRSWKEALQRHGKSHLALAATWLILAGLLIGGPHRETIGLDLGVRPLDYLATQAGVLLWYLRLCFWPCPLVITYDDWPIVGFAQALPQGMIILALVVGTGWALWRRSGLGFLGAWFFLILAPTSSFVPIVTEVAAERRMYLPLAAVVVLVITIAHRFFTVVFSRLSLRPLLRSVTLAGLVLGTAVALACATRARNHDYSTTLAIWEDALAQRPLSATAHNTLGAIKVGQGRLDEAFAHFITAVRIRPAYPEAHYNLGIELVRQSRYAEAVVHYTEALHLRSAYPEARNNLGIALARQGQLAEAIAQYTEALRMKPAYADAHNNLANALLTRGQTEEAVAHYTEALRLQPTYPEAHNNLGIALIRQGRIDDAIAHFNEALRLQPAYLQARQNLGDALSSQSRWTEAIEHYQQVLRLNPNSAEVRERLQAAIEKQAAANPPP